MPSPNLLATSIELTVLGLLEEHGDMYALELMRASDSTLKKRSTVYAALARLESRKLVTSSLVDGTHPGPPRPRYSITGQGKRMLQACRLLDDQTGDQ